MIRLDLIQFCFVPVSTSWSACSLRLLGELLFLMYVFLFLVNDLCAVTVYTCLKIYLHKKALFIFVNNVTFFSMLYHGDVEYVANTWFCVLHDCEMGGQLRASE